jgi:magnesium-transporting ATPase (P-type)
VVVVKNGVLPCDLVVLQGEAVVDENMLTGEAVPIRKVKATATVRKTSVDKLRFERKHSYYLVSYGFVREVSILRLHAHFEILSSPTQHSPIYFMGFFFYNATGRLQSRGGRRGRPRLRP